MNDPILYQNDDRTITLLDIPASIAHAQGNPSRVLSSPARSEPFPSTEPKTQKARERVLLTVQKQIDYAGVLCQALDEIRKHHHGPWALDRFCGDNSQDSDDGQEADSLLSALFSSVARAKGVSAMADIIAKQSDAPEILNDWDGSYYNDSDEHAGMRILLPDPKATPATKSNASTESPASETNTLTFRIPTRASFLLSDCAHPSKLRNHIRWLSQEYYRPRNYDFILLDPPWENRSAKRRAAYDTHSILPLIIDMDLSSYLQSNGLVGIWVTNRPAHRELILGAGGVFEALNVSLIEEWIWVKTTTKGEPVTQLDGVWRKPYEVLLLGRAPASRLQVAQPLVGDVVRRVVAGVPDFHSRKPCLKTLIEPFLPVGYQALEVFARYLVEGWMSWGNEVLKYNYESCYEHEEE